MEAPSSEKKKELRGRVWRDAGEQRHEKRDQTCGERGLGETTKKRETCARRRKKRRRVKMKKKEMVTRGGQTVG